MTRLLDRLPSRSLLYTLAFLGCCAAGLLYWPITANDTDLWFHMNAGRFVFANHAVPREAFFSFLAPVRPWADYYWLFQVLAYGIHLLAGYPGLIVLRTAAYAGLMAVIAVFLLPKERRHVPAYPCVLICLFAMALLPRFVVVRPHLLTYLILSAAIVVLEARGRSLLLLPALAVLLGNSHGVYYPVWIFVLGSYLADLGLRRASRPEAFSPRRTGLVIVISMAAVFLTPFGSQILGKPFIPLDYSIRRLAELKAIGFADLFTLSIVNGAPSLLSVSNILLGLSLMSLLSALTRRTLRPAHAFLFAGGLYLLTKGERFYYETGLLALPLLKAHPLSVPGAPGGLPRSTRLALWAVLMPMPFVYLVQGFSNRPAYPVSDVRLPVGVAAFLEHVDARGRLLNHPDSGGYLEWRLFPKMRIAMDLLVPCVFGDADLFLISEAYTNPDLLGRVLNQYDPDFITVPLRFSGFPEMIARHPQYVPVFFDDSEVLYAQAGRRPDLAAGFFLPLDPFQPVSGNGADAAEHPAAQDSAKAMAPFLARMIAISPGTLATRVLAARVLLRGGDPEGALAHAEAGIRYHPEAPAGYFLRGRILRSQGRLSGALASFRTARAKSSPFQQSEVYREIAETLRLGGDLAGAMRAIRAADPSVPPDSWFLNQESR